MNQLREERKKQTAEVFTPPHLVTEMLSKLPEEVWEENKTFCDPACGNGNFLVEVLWKKIEKGHNILEAIQSVYGVDIMKDNIRECRFRLLKVVSLWEKVTEDHIRAVFKNIVCVDPNKHPDGALDYDFNFKRTPKRENVERWMRYIEKDNLLDEVELPVESESFLKNLFDNVNSPTVEDNVVENNMRTRVVEVAIAFGDDSGTWYTKCIEIPYDTPDDQVEQVALDAVPPEVNIQHKWVYCISDKDDDEL